MARLDNSVTTSADGSDNRGGFSPLGLGRLRRFSGWFVMLLIASLAASFSFGATYLVLTDAIQLDDTGTAIRLLLLFNFALGLALFALATWSLVKFFIARQQGQSGSRLQVRLVGMFTLIAMVPAIVVAIFSVVTLNLSLETWFSERVSSALESSLGAATVYVNEIQDITAGETAAMAVDMNAAKVVFDVSPPAYSQVLGRQAQTRPYIEYAAVIRSDGFVLAVAQPTNFEDYYVAPDPQLFDRASDGEVIVDIYGDDRVLGIVRLDNFEDAYLYTVRPLRDNAVQNVIVARRNLAAYQTAEVQRSSILWLFALSFLVLALLILLFAVWMGLAAAGRIVSPIGRLVGASERVSEGDLSARVEVGLEDDEVATLSRSFNRMTGQLQTQRDELIEANRQYDRRRRFTEAVLGGVSAGVMGFDGQGRVTIANRSALAMLNVSREDVIDHLLWEVVPALGGLVKAALAHPEAEAQGEVEFQIKGRTRNLTVQVTGESGLSDETSGSTASITKSFVVTFDDVTDLVSAQRMSAWADVARRIAHEIKNPLTPIQLSAERLRRKYMKEIETDPEVFDQCTETIIRQVGDIGKMVDEFSAFARMPEPVLRPHNIVDTVRDAVFLQRVAFKHTKIEADLPGTKIMVSGDERQLNQAMINLLKNAAEAIDTRRKQENNPKLQGHVLARVLMRDGVPEVEILDNGCGLPKEQQHRLTEPYVTTREKGTGIGLAIVKKVMEDHGGELILENASEDAVGKWDRAGARIRMIFPEIKVSEKESAPADLVGIEGD